MQVLLLKHINYHPLKPGAGQISVDHVYGNLSRQLVRKMKLPCGNTAESNGCKSLFLRQLQAAPVTGGQLLLLVLHQQEARQRGNRNWSAEERQNEEPDTRLLNTAGIINHLTSIRTVTSSVMTPSSTVKMTSCRPATAPGQANRWFTGSKDAPSGRKNDFVDYAQNCKNNFDGFP